MKVWKQFKTLAAAMPNLRSRRCWSKCNHCKKNWAETGTAYVSMTIELKQGKQKTRYICDDCLKIHDQD